MIGHLDRISPPGRIEKMPVISRLAEHLTYFRIIHTPYKTSEKVLGCLYFSKASTYMYVLDSPASFRALYAIDPPPWHLYKLGLAFVMRNIFKF